MKFIIEHDLQGKSRPGMPVTVEVAAEPRRTYDGECKCETVYRIAEESMAELVELGLVLEGQRSDEVVICSCLGRAISERLAPAEAIQAIWDAFCVCNSNGGLSGTAKRHLEPAIYAAMKAIRHEPFVPTLERGLCCLDTETTGVDPVLDRLVSIGVVVLNPDGTRRRWETLLNPEMPIPPAVTEIHGITDEMVASAPKFHDIAHKFMNGLTGKDLLLYNGWRLDLPIIDESLRRVGLSLNLAGVRVIDAAGLFFKENPRDLSAFVKRYARRDHEGAHGAAADAEGTLDGYLNMLAEHDDLRAMTLEQQAAHSMYGDDSERLPCDLAGKLYLKGGEVYFGFGKAKDKRVRDDAGYAYWMLKCTDPPFPGSTRDCLRAELERVGL